MILLSICIMISAIGILMLISSFLDKDDVALFVVGILILLFTGVFGFGLLCSKKITSTIEKQHKFTYAKTASTVVVETNEITSTFKDAHTYNSISDSSKAFIRTDYNVYGIEVSKSLVIK